MVARKPFNVHRIKPKKWKKKIFHWTQIHRGLEREFGERFTKECE